MKSIKSIYVLAIVALSSLIALLSSEIENKKSQIRADALELLYKISDIGIDEGASLDRNDLIRKTTNGNIVYNRLKTKNLEPGG